MNRFLFTLASAMIRLGHEVHVVCRAAEPVGDVEAWIRRVWDIDEIPQIHLIRSKPYRRFGSSAGYNYKTAAKIAYEWYTKGSRIIQQVDPSAVILNGVVPLRWSGPKLATFHHVDETMDTYSFWGKKLYRFVDRVVCVSEFSQQMAREIGIKSSKVIPLPLDIRKFAVKPHDQRENLVLHIGTVPRKNPNVSIAAVAQLFAQGIDVKLVVVGRHSEHNERLKQAHSDALGKWLTLEERISNEELKELYSRAKLFILPSDREGFSYVTIEAAACGTPVVASEGVPKEAIVDGETGYRLAGLDAADYAQKLKELLTDQEKWGYMSTNARTCAEKYDATAVAQQWIDLIQEMIKAK